MPQMAPLYWEILFIMFIMSLMTLSMIIFHYPKITIDKSKSKLLKINNINWKW
nr:ATP synthase F0 subunit 8 [Poecilocoris nepalensis]